MAFWYAARPAQSAVALMSVRRERVKEHDPGVVNAVDHIIEQKAEEHEAGVVATVGDIIEHQAKLANDRWCGPAERCQHRSSRALVGRRQKVVLDQLEDAAPASGDLRGRERAF